MQDSTCANVISFKGGATVDRAKPRNDLLVIELTIRDIDVARVLNDTTQLPPPLAAAHGEEREVA